MVTAGASREARSRFLRVTKQCRERKNTTSWCGMNEAHLRILSSDEWVQTLEEEFLPWLARAGDLGDNVLELGPGPA